MVSAYGYRHSCTVLTCSRAVLACAEAEATRCVHQRQHGRDLLGARTARPRHSVLRARAVLSGKIRLASALAWGISHEICACFIACSQPVFPDCLNNYANVLRAVERTDEAIALYQVRTRTIANAENNALASVLTDATATARLEARPKARGRPQQHRQCLQGKPRDTCGWS